MSLAEAEILDAPNPTAARASVLAASFALLFLLALQSLSAQAIPIRLTQYSHTAWRLQDGLFDAAPLSVRQTGDGYLWIGTASGLVRFDGTTFTPWRDPKSGTLARPVYSMMTSRDGTLWIGEDDDLYHLVNGQLVAVPGKLGRVNAIMEDDRGVVWIARSRQNDDRGPLCELAGSNMQCHGRSEGVNCLHGNSLLQDAAKTIWIGGSNSLCAWKPGAAQFFPTRASSAPGIGSLLLQADGSILVGFAESGPNAGVQTFSGGKFSSFHLPGLDGTKTTAPVMLKDRVGGIWIGTVGQGIFHIDQGSVDHFGTADGLSSNSIQDLYEDREGNVWVATLGGIDQFHRTPIVSFSTQQNLTSDSMFSVLSAGGAVLAGSDNGLQVVTHGKASSAIPKDVLPGKMVESIAQDSLGSLWMGVNDRLVRYSHGSYSTINPPDGKPFGPIDIAIDSNQTVWVFQRTRGENQNLQLVRSDRSVTAIQPPVSQVRSIHADASGMIWIASREGKVFRYRNSAFEAIPDAPQKPNFNDLLTDSPNSFWAATGLKGLFRWKDNRWGVLNTAAGLPCNDVDSMILDGTGALWIDLACGFVKLPQEELNSWWSNQNYHPKFTFFGALDGAKTGYSDFAPTSARSAGGQLWFANNAALLMVDPNRLERNDLPPPVHILSLVADRVSHAAAQRITLPPLTRDISIDYAALSLKVPKAVRYRYKLSIIDKDWQEVEGRRQAFYMNLPPGNYQFQVIACNNDGVWNTTGDSLTFMIQPAFYQTLWFRAVLALVVSFLIWTIFRLRLRAATSRVEAQMTERLGERDRIARELHDTLLQGFQGLILQLQTAIRRIPEAFPERQHALAVLDHGDEILIQGRDRVRDLRSHQSSGGSLVTMLERVVEQIQSSSDASLTLAFAGEPQDVQLLTAEELALFAREALSNAARHAQAKRISCETRFDRKELFLAIGDDGIGIPQEYLTEGGKQGHWGLQGMRERADKLGAKVTFSSGATGTRIELQVPARIAYPQKRTSTYVHEFLHNLKKSPNARNPAERRGCGHT